jgi:phospholipase C
MLRRLTAAAGLAAAALLMSAASPAFAQPKSFDHVFVIMMENQSFDELIGRNVIDSNGNPTGAFDTPFLTFEAPSLSGYAFQYYGVTHPSLPNYLASIGGDYFDVQDDNPSCFAQPPPGPGCHLVNANNLVDNLENKGLTWTVLEESMPKVGWLGTQYPGSAPRLYAQKHNPFVYFQDVATNSARLSHILPLTPKYLGPALSNPATVTYIVPNQCHDMHGTTTCSNSDKLLSEGDGYLKKLVQQVVTSSGFTANSALFVVWDEDDYSSRLWCCSSPRGDGGGHTLGLVFSSTSAGKQSLTQYNEYSMLRTIEEGLGLPYLGHSGDSAVAPMWDLF